MLKGTDSKNTFTEITKVEEIHPVPHIKELMIKSQSEKKKKREFSSLSEHPPGPQDERDETSATRPHGCMAIKGHIEISNYENEDYELSTISNVVGVT